MNEITNRNSGFPSAPKTTASMMISRQAQEVQAAMVVAKQFPRDQDYAFQNIMRACQRPSLAESAIYEYPRGGTSVTGPSIRLAEAIAQTWGNIDFGFIELDQKDGESSVMAYCWDLENNTRQSKIFSVPHIRVTKSGSKKLTDPRDIYEMVANQAARRVRSCILSIIPGDVVDAAVAECQNTLKNLNNSVPLADRIDRMIGVFQNEFGVPVKCLEEYVGCNVGAFTEQSVIRLGQVYTSLHEGRESVGAYFNVPKTSEFITDGGEKKTGRKKMEASEMPPMMNVEVDGNTGEVLSLDNL